LGHTTIVSHMFLELRTHEKRSSWNREIMRERVLEIWNSWEKSFWNLELMSSWVLGI